jgi:hypothetical protein
MGMRTRRKDRFRSVLMPIMLASAVGTMATQCLPRLHAPSDPMLNGDWREWEGARVIAVAPGVPVIGSGPDGRLGTPDDWTVPGVVGDLDIVLRAGTTELSSPIPPSARLKAEPATAGMGNEIDFSVVAVDGQRANPLDEVVVSPSFGRNPVIVLGFADLDGDGWIGPTLRDQNALDVEVEESELTPVAMQLADLTGTGAKGRLRLLAAGPPGNPLKIALTAISYTGSPQMGRFGGVVPLGPAVSTALPYPVPATPDGVIDAGPAGPEAPTATRPLGLELDPAWPVGPVGMGSQDAHLIAVDGSRPSIDVVTSQSREAARFGFVRSALHPDYQSLDRRTVRPGFDERFRPHPYEVLDELGVADDGRDSVDVIHVVPLDALGNITKPGLLSVVTVTTRGGLRIVSPDADGDPTREMVVVGSPYGARIVIDDAGDAGDDPLKAGLVVDSRLGASSLPVWLPDADVDDSGRVDAADELALMAAMKTERGDAGFEPRFDVDRNGRVDRNDLVWVRQQRGASVAVP